MSAAAQNERQGLVVVGVDGGATATVAEAARIGESQTGLVRLGRGRAGPSNPQVIGFEAAAANIRQAVLAAIFYLSELDGETAGATSAASSIAAVCLAIAGAGRPDDQRRLCRLIDDLGPAAVFCVHDGLTPLAAVSAEVAGVTVISGTGSFAYARTRDGREARCGGWGHYLGDEGSGFRIGLAAVEAVIRHADGRAPETALTNRMLQELKIAEPMELVAALRGETGGLAVDRVAQLAPLVFDAAATGDSAAREIVDRSAAALGRMIEAVHRKLRLDESVPIAMAGGVLCGQPQFRESLQGRLRELGLNNPVAIVEEPVTGATALAARRARGDESLG